MLAAKRYTIPRLVQGAKTIDATDKCNVFELRYERRWQIGGTETREGFRVSVVTTDCKGSSLKMQKLCFSMHLATCQEERLCLDQHGIIQAAGLAKVGEAGV